MNESLYFTQYFPSNHILINNCYYLILLHKTVPNKNKNTYYHTAAIDIKMETNKFKKMILHMLLFWWYN